MARVTGYNASSQGRSNRPFVPRGWRFAEDLWDSMVDLGKRALGMEDEPDPEPSSSLWGEGMQQEEPEVTTDSVMEIQQELKRLNFYKGPVDGVMNQELKQAMARAVEIAESDGDGAEQQPMEGQTQNRRPRRSAADFNEPEYDDKALSDLLN